MFFAFPVIVKLQSYLREELFPALVPTLFTPQQDDEQRFFTLKESFWFVLCCTTPQGGGDPPKATSGRILAQTW